MHERAPTYTEKFSCEGNRFPIINFSPELKGIEALPDQSSARKREGLNVYESFP